MVNITNGIIAGWKAGMKNWDAASKQIDSPAAKELLKRMEASSTVGSNWAANFANGLIGKYFPGDKSTGDKDLGKKEGSYHPPEVTQWEKLGLVIGAGSSPNKSADETAAAAKKLVDLGIETIKGVGRVVDAVSKINLINI